MRRSISFQREIDEFAQNKSKKYFGGNLSSYISFLIARDKDKEQKKIQERKEE